VRDGSGVSAGSGGEEEGALGMELHPLPRLGRALLPVRTRGSTGRAEGDCRATWGIGGQHLPTDAIGRLQGELGGVALAGGVPEVPAHPGSDLGSAPLSCSPPRHGK